MDLHVEDRGLRLHLRPVEAGDAEAMHRIVSDWRVVRQLGGWPWPADPAFTRYRCARRVKNGFVWSVFEGGDLRGSFGIVNGSVGYMFDLAHAGRGIASAVLARGIAEARANWPWKELRADAWDDNPASQRVLTRQGFVHWRTGYDRAKARRRPVLSRAYRLPLEPAGHSQ